MNHSHPFQSENLRPARTFTRKIHRNRFLIILISISLFSFCQRRLILREGVADLNEHYKDRVYILKENINVGNNEILKKDTHVKIWIESTASLLKVKCYSSTEEREYAIGKLIMYIVNDDYKDKKVFYF